MAKDLSVMTADLLAIDGGEPVRREPLPSWPKFDNDEIDAVAAVLGSGKVNYWTGEHGRMFEKEFAEYAGCSHGVALANGTAALDTALYALGIGRGDEVVVPSRTFIATASAVVLRGARPVMADIDAESKNLSVETVGGLITANTRAIIAVHLAGWPCDMDPLAVLARKHGISLIEDCAQAHGATYKGRPVGSLGDVGAFSFCQDKIMSTGGEGGMLTTNVADIHKRAWSYKDHGKSFHKAQEPKQTTGFCWLHDSFGTNWRLTESQSAIGRLQLAKLDSWVERRRQNAGLLVERLSVIPGLRVPQPSSEFGHSYYRFYSFVRPEMLRSGWDRDRIMQAISAEGIPCFSGTCAEVYLEKAFVEAGLSPCERFPVARMLGETSLVFLVHPTLGESDMEATSLAVEKVFRKAAV